MKNASADAAKDKTQTDHGPADGGWRETVESIAMAIILALLFRGFIAEAFVIPTGSMAPTLRGRHKDVRCPECGYWYQAGASIEVDRNSGAESNLPVVAATCPVCYYSQEFDPSNHPNQGSFSGDRIIVSKFAYDLAEPRRWDVIVFKYPGDATQNYIKRLAGLPNETIRIWGGNIYIKKKDEAEFHIARKPPDKLNAMLQLVHDNDYLAKDLLAAGWPARWEEADLTSPLAQTIAPAWQKLKEGREFICDGASPREAWLRYRHILPDYKDWANVVHKSGGLRTHVAGREGELIADFYAYNTFMTARGGSREQLGMFWVDDLAVEALVTVEKAAGEVLLDLVRGGIHHECRIDVTTGNATLSRSGLSGDRQGFASDDGAQAETRTAKTSVRGAGSYRLRLSNCDHELLLWVNGKTVQFDGPTKYPSSELIAPVWTPEEPGDLQPARIGSKGAAVRVSQLRIFRDKYYIAQKNDAATKETFGSEYVGKAWNMGVDQIIDEFKEVERWPTSPVFSDRNAVEFPLDSDQFLPLGDNSPQSQDARTWPKSDGNRIYTPNYVRRDLLIGKALFVYWPHTWNAPIPYMPNPSEMRPIR